MHVKLGEMLVKAGAITPSQLDEVLKCQVIFGGRLGTNLVEMGFLGEDDLARFLSRKLGVPAAEPEELTEIPAEVIQLVPRELAAKHKVVPLRLDKKRLTLVMVDPLDFAAIDAISFKTGCIITPVVSPELRLTFCLEKYYEIPREVRYIRLSDDSRRSARRSASNAPKPEESAQVSVTLDDGETFEFPPIAEFRGFSEETDADALDSLGTPEQNPAVQGYSIDTLARELAEAGSRDEIADVLLAFLARSFQQAAFFLVKGNCILGWKAMAQGELNEELKNLVLPLDSESLLKLVVEKKNFYMGPVPATPENTRMLTGVKAGNPESVLLLPLMITGKVVAIVYLDGAIGTLVERLVELQKLVGKAAMAFEILILRNKILST
jgi:hypothetical protein